MNYSAPLGHKIRAYDAPLEINFSESRGFDPFLVLISSFCPGHKNLPPLHPKSLNMREFATVTVGGADVFLSRSFFYVLISASCKDLLRRNGSNLFLDIFFNVHMKIRHFTVLCMIVNTITTIIILITVILITSIVLKM